jgi:hypothetical protein
MVCRNGGSGGVALVGRCRNGLVGLVGRCHNSLVGHCRNGLVGLVVAVVTDWWVWWVALVRVGWVLWVAVFLRRKEPGMESIHYGS